jgi:hypothetical protein
VGPVAFTGETDRVYDSTSTSAIIDAEGNRTITVAKAGSASTVVWNPYPEAQDVGGQQGIQYQSRNGRTCCGRSASSWWWLVLTSDRRPVGRRGG